MNRAGSSLLWCLGHPARVLAVPALWAGACLVIWYLAQQGDDALDLGF